MPDLRELLADAADPPPEGDFDAADLLTRAARRRRRRQLAIAAPVTGLVVLTALLGVRAFAPAPSVRFADGDRTAAPQAADPTTPGIAAPAAVLQIPPTGEVIPGFLDDGTEVFAVNADGQVHVFDARRPGIGSFPPSLVGWCPSSAQFEDDLFGSRFDVHGRYVGGPSPTDLPAYGTTIVGEQVHVGARPSAASRSRDASPPTGPPCSGEDGPMPVGHHLPPAEALSVEQALQTRPGMEVVVEARVEIRADGPRLCAIPEAGALVRNRPNPAELRCTGDAPVITGTGLAELPEDVLYAHEGRHVLTRTTAGFTDLVIGAGTAAVLGRAGPEPTAPPSAMPATVTAADHALMDAFSQFAASPSDATFKALPLAADGVRLGLADELLATLAPQELRDPDAWWLEAEAFRAYVGPFSALDLLAREESLQVSVGPHMHCASPPVPPPAEVAALRRVSAQPQEMSSCLEWFTVDLFVNADGVVQAITLDLYEP